MAEKIVGWEICDWISGNMMSYTNQAVECSCSEASYGQFLSASQA